MIRSKLAAPLFLFIALAGGLDSAVADDPVALVKAGRGLLEWIPLVETGSATLTLADPRGEVRTVRFGPGATPALSLFDAQGASLPDGSYTWELRSAEGAQSGSFTIADGALVSPDAAEQPRLRTAADQVVPDDLIVDGKGCIGLGCVNNEAFGAEALRLKQGVVRLRFQDTSSGAFPGNDWQITVNDSASGGANRFSIEDVDGAKTPLTIRAGAPDNSVYVDGTGRFGLGTATPAERFHLLDSADANTLATVENTSTGVNGVGVLRARSDSATVNFQAHGSGRTISRFGQTLASWTEFLQVSGNGLIIGTVVDKPLILGTNSANRLHITPTGSVGLGTSAPAQKFHLAGSDGATSALIQETNGTAATRTMLQLSNNGGVRLNYVDTSLGVTWGANMISGNFKFIKAGAGLTAFDLQGNGNLTIGGTLTQNSDRNTKHEIVPVEPEEVLAKVVTLPISTWNRKGDDPQVRHMGPMAQDFAATFGLGTDERTIATLDMAGVSLASIQALYGKMTKEMAEKDAEIDVLRERVAALEKLIAKLAEGR
ncbi:MAG TPA: tail fiber domain-containing protein [Thermoanaerobaculia bacterium]|nr:tail fiber domain-containing protein [Thermoanaerobaculia bacterium]